MKVVPGSYAVIFTSHRANDDPDYHEMASEMEALARNMPGYLGHESVRDPGGLGITVSYWESEAAIAAWKAHADHSIARERGRAEFHAAFEVAVARVERAYGFSRDQSED